MHDQVLCLCCFAHHGVQLNLCHACGTMLASDLLLTPHQHEEQGRWTRHLSRMGLIRPGRCRCLQSDPSFITNHPSSPSLRCFPILSSFCVLFVLFRIGTGLAARRNQPFRMGQVCSSQHHRQKCRWQSLFILLCDRLRAKMSCLECSTGK